MHQGEAQPAEVHIAIRASARAGLFDLVTISDVHEPEETISMLELSDIKLLSAVFWPEQDWTVRLHMLKHVSSTPREPWAEAVTMVTLSPKTPIS